MKYWFLLKYFLIKKYINLNKGKAFENSFKIAKNQDFSIWCYFKNLISPKPMEQWVKSNSNKKFNMDSVNFQYFVPFSVSGGSNIASTKTNKFKWRMRCVLRIMVAPMFIISLFRFCSVALSVVRVIGNSWWKFFR